MAYGTKFEHLVAFTADGQCKSACDVNLVADPKTGRTPTMIEYGIAMALLQKQLARLHAETADTAKPGDGTMAGEYLQAYMAEMKREERPPAAGVAGRIGPDVN
jgi:hypothetical protein